MSRLPEAFENAAQRIAHNVITNGLKELELVQASELIPRAIEWLWDGWLAQGKFHLLAGAPGVGKTTLATALAAPLTIGGRWPDGTKCSVGNVAMWSGEDDIEDTLAPRFMLSGADMKRVYFVGGVTDSEGKRAFDPSRDIESLKAKLAQLGGVKLLIVDPIVSAVSGDSHKNAETRRSLQPLADLAASSGCAVLGITHFSKGSGGRDPVERLAGSLAFGALARVVMVAAKHQTEQEGPQSRLFLRAKNNYGPDSGGFQYEVREGELFDYPGVTASAVRWGAPVQGAARELLAEVDAFEDSEGGTLGQAKAFLEDLLLAGPLSSKVIQADSQGAGHSWSTIRRAQKALGIIAKKQGMSGGWTWELPTKESSALPSKMLKNPEGAQQKMVGIFAKDEHLRVVEVEI